MKSTTLFLSAFTLLATTTFGNAQSTHQHSTMAQSVAAQSNASTLPTQPGQDAFGTIQEIVRILEADPRTDWSKINLGALREHLIDMNEVTLRAELSEKPVAGGVEILVTGNGRTLSAIRRMVPTQARELSGHKGWKTMTSEIANGIRLTVVADSESETVHLRGLGFIGLMTTGTHHQVHHLALARGENMH